MATSKKLQEDFLTCHICMEIYQQPCTLSCEHTYCKDCLTKYILTQSDAVKDKVIPCPSCRRHIQVPDPRRPAEEWAGQFKAGLVVQGLMDSFVHSHTDEEMCSVCKTEGKTSRGDHWCQECEAPFCDSCLKLHNKMPSMSQHGITGLSGETPRAKVKKRKYVCQEHEEKMKLFCKDCKKVLCTICCSVDHRACKDVVTIQAMLPQVKQEMKDRQTKFTDGIEKTSEQVSAEKKKVDEIVGQATTVKTEIKQTVKEAIYILKEKEKQLLHKVDDVTSTRTEELRAKVKSGEITIQMYQQQSQFIQQALGSEDEAQLYELYLSAAGDVTQSGSEDGIDIAGISFTHNLGKLRADVGLMDVQTFKGEVTDLTVTPILHEVIETKHGDQLFSDLRDVVCLNIGGIDSIVVTDVSNHTVKSVYMENGRRSSSQLKVIHYPWSLSVLHANTVVVSVPHKNKILTVGVNPELELISTITTSKQYFGVAVLDNSTLVAGSRDPSSVDVLDLSGNVLRSFTTLTTMQKCIKEPYYLHVTNQGNILISDFGLKSIISLSPAGEVEFHYSPRGARELKYPRGISATKGGHILLADSCEHNVVHLTQSGEFVKDILTPQDGLTDPFGICVNGDKLYVATRYHGVHVYKFSDTS